ncbi:MAG: hypothetical protein Q7S11_02235 [bacterium]|nr:hypothetical protein [bacterium]
MGSLEEIKSLIHSYDDWEDIKNKPRPYVFAINKPEQSLVYFGSTHSRESNNEQFIILEKEWEQFLKKTGEENRVVFVEGGLRTVRSTKEEAILKDSESGFITYLANQATIEIVCPEPDRNTERKELLKEFTKEEIQYYYFARTIPSWHEVRKTSDVNFADHLDRYKQELRKGVDDEWRDFDFSLENMRSIHRKIFHSEFDEQDIDYIKKILNPTTEESVVNKVARASSAFRDVNIISKIEEYWNLGKSIFAVFGFAHAVTEEPALRKLLT